MLAVNNFYSLAKAQRRKEKMKKHFKNFKIMKEKIDKSEKN